MRNLESLGLRVEDGRLFVLDQRTLPARESWLEAESPADAAELIRTLAVRGAPLIGVTAALSLASHLERGASWPKLVEAAARLKAARPTAVNLAACVDRAVAAGPERLAAEAEEIFDEDVELCRLMGERGASRIADGASVLTHCNTGGLATAGIGTALGAIRTAHEQGKRVHVWVDETRPVLQGARLTAWELGRLGIPYTLICDGMAAGLMAAGKVAGVFVGADRVARNGDFANKIGTYGLAVLARHHRVPFYCVAPRTTVDLSTESGGRIPIEQRDPGEVRGSWAPKDAPVFNPAFDVTPAELLTALVLDCGVFERADLERGALASALALPAGRQAPR